MNGEKIRIGFSQDKFAIVTYGKDIADKEIAVLIDRLPKFHNEETFRRR